MNSRFRKTRRNRSSKSQSGGALFQYKSLRIFGINEKLGRNIYGIKTLKDAMAAAGKGGGHRLDEANFLQRGNLFNGSAAHYTYKGRDFLLGCCRTLSNSDGNDDRTNTSIRNKDPFSPTSAWSGGWGGPDYPLFFALDLQTQEIVFLHMQFEINYITPKNYFTGQMEDPRIMIHPDADIVLFYGHHNTPILNHGFYEKMGLNLSAELNAGAKSPKPAGATPQLPFTSYCTKGDMNLILEAHFFAKDKAVRVVPNREWKPLCANLLNIYTEKNWTIIANKAGDVPVFDFVRSFGEFSKGMVVYRARVDQLISPAILLNGTVNEFAFKCLYIQSIEGKVKLPGEAIETRGYDGYFDVPSNDKITTISFKTKVWFNTLVKMFFDYIPKGMTFFKSAKCTVTKTDDALTYGYPFYQNSGQQTIIKILYAGLVEKSILFVKGISTGGPACSILGGNAAEVIGVGHLKVWHCNVYIAMVAALLYRSDPKFQAFMVNTGFDAAEQAAFLEFARYLTEEINIFRYTYTLILQLEPFISNAKIDGLIKGEYEKQNILHKNQMYSSFFYKMRKDNFQLLSLTPQFFVDNYPTECHAPVLQFCSTIANNGKDEYYIPYGDNDSRARIMMISRDDLHSYLKLEKLINEQKPNTDHDYYLKIMKEFYKVHMMKAPDA